MGVIPPPPPPPDLTTWFGERTRRGVEAEIERNLRAIERIRRGEWRDPEFLSELVALGDYGAVAELLPARPAPNTIDVRT